MAKHRARKQQHAAKHSHRRISAPAVPVSQELRVQPPKPQFEVTRAHTQAQPSVKAPPVTTTTQSLLRVDQSYLRADLRRSLLVSAFLFAILIGISWLVRYNGLATLQSYVYSINQMMGR